MSDDKKQKQDALAPREPLIVEVPTVLTRIVVQLRAQETNNDGSSSSSDDDVLGEVTGS